VSANAAAPHRAVPRTIATVAHQGHAAPYTSASVAALLASCGYELVAVSAPVDVTGLVLLGCLCVVLGAVHGLGWQLLFALVRRLPRVVHWLFWCLIGAATGAWLAHVLGAVSRLHGPYRMLALQALAVSALQALGLSAVGVGMQPTAAHPRGAIFRYGLPVRTALCGSLIATAIGCFYADTHYYVGLYIRAHDALRWASWWSLMFALVLVPEWLRVPQPPGKRAALTLLLAALLVPLLAIVHPRGPATLMLRPWSASLVHVAQAALDFDHDGYAALLGGGDCNELDPRVNPGSPEIPGNGIDDNCMLGDAKPRPHARALPDAATGQSPYDVVLVTIDSLRPDHLGLFNPVYGPAGRSTSPNLDAWARRGVVFDRAYTPGAWTSIAIASIMRGLYPRRLQWTKYYETNLMHLLRKRNLDHLGRAEQPHQMFPLAFTDPNPTLASLLHRRGMRTAAVVHDGFSRMLTHGVGVERDFDVYWETETWEHDHEDDSGTADLAIRELGRAPKDRRLFLWVHFFGPHSPNSVHPGVPQYGPTLVDGYDHEIRYLDSQLPRLWDAIARRGVPTVIAVTGDHGEVFGENARMHGFSITEQDIRVPLILNVPGWSPHRVSQLVGTVDLFPTLLALTNTPAPQAIDGVDLTDWSLGTAPQKPRRLISETWRYEANGQPIIDLIAAFDGQRKIVVDTVDHSFRAYDQRSAVESPSWVDLRSSDPLTHFLLEYVEETGGPLVPVD
jgi:arylsulfatase A-like enzyme